MSTLEIKLVEPGDISANTELWYITHLAESEDVSRYTRSPAVVE
jgi:hypothetical protein